MNKKFKLLLMIILISSININITAQSTDGSTNITIDASKIKGRIDKNIYGHFSEHLGKCIYGGIWVGEDSPIPNTRGMRNDVIEALKKIKVPLLRWPGGCFADEYHWMDGIGPRENRPTMINTHWGGVVEDNSFGTHEFLDFCSLIGAEPYISGNVGSGTVEEFSKWVEYINSDNIGTMTNLRKKNGREKSWGVKYWGIGNESWGCGGNMRPEYYADLVRRYSTYCRNYGDNRVIKIASGPYGDNYEWTETLMKQSSSFFDGLGLHYYTFAQAKAAADFDESGWFDVMKKTLMMDELIEKHSAIMDKYDPDKRIALIVDEWGTWYNVEPGTNPAFLYQQNTLRDALVAGSNLNIFNNHSDRVRMANIAQMVNVLQAIILTEDDKMVLTPTYHIFDLFKVHQNAVLLPIELNTSNYIFNNDTLPAVNCSASFDTSGKIHISLCNVNPNSNEKVTVDLMKLGITNITAQVLTSSKMNDLNSFDNPNVIAPKDFSDFKKAGNILEVNMPAKSIIVFELDADLESLLRKAVELNNPKPGVKYQYYEGEASQTSDLDNITPLKNGVTEKFDILENNSGEYFGIKYNGYIKIPANGWYTFYTNSDDGTKLFIDDELIVNNDGQHAPTERSGNVLLKEGFHKIDVNFYQGYGGLALSVSIEGPGLEKQTVPAEFLFHEIE